MRPHELSLPRDLVPMELTSFANSFKSEAHLTQILVELLRRMGREGVQNLHGQQEFGKDIIFYAPGGFHERRLYACVVKNFKLTGGMDSDRGVRTVFHQAEAAFDTPVTTPKGHAEYVESVYIIAPFDCTQVAMAAIREKLQERSGQVTFLCGAALLELFICHWPDFVLFDSGTLTKYLSGLPSTFATDSALTNLVRRYTLLSDAVKPLTQVYVQRDFHEVLLRYSLSTLGPTSSLRLDRPLRLEQIRQARTIVTSFVETVQTAFRMISTEADTTSDQMQRLFATTQTHWERAVVTHQHRLAANMEKFERVRRESHDLKYSGKKHVPALRPPTKEELAKVRLVERPESELELTIDDNKTLQESSEATLSECLRHHKTISATIDIGNQFVAANHCLGSSDLQHGRLSYNLAQNLARQVPRLISAEPTTNRALYEGNILEAELPAILITGPAGFGKTSFCKWNALKDAKDFLNRKGRIVPVFVQLHQIQPKAGEPFESVLIPREDVRDLLTVNSLGDDRRIRLYLDGLDEVPAQSVQETIVELARKATAERKDIQVVITARDYVKGDWLSWLPRFRISDLSDPQIQELVSNWLDQDEARINHFFAQLKDLPALRQLMGVPLLGTLIIAVYRRTGKIPRDRVQLYGLFVNLHCGGWDLVKNVRRESKFGSHDKELMLSRFAARLHYDNQRDGDGLFL